MFLHSLKSCNVLAKPPSTDEGSCHSIVSTYTQANAWWKQGWIQRDLVGGVHWLKNFSVERLPEFAASGLYRLSTACTKVVLIMHQLYLFLTSFIMILCISSIIEITVYYL